MTDTERQIYNLARASSFIEVDHVAYSISITPGWAQKVMRRMVDTGQLTRERHGLRYRYFEAFRCPHCGQVIR